MQIKPLNLTVDVVHNRVSMPCTVLVYKTTSRVYSWGGWGPEITYERHPLQYVAALRAALEMIKP